jgi:hypothetical protein
MRGRRSYTNPKNIGNSFISRWHKIILTLNFRIGLHLFTTYSLPLTVYSCIFDKINITTFPLSKLDEVYFSDFYPIPQFGKTILGQEMFYAKQSQNIELIKKISKIAL